MFRRVHFLKPALFNPPTYPNSLSAQTTFLSVRLHHFPTDDARRASWMFDCDCIYAINSVHIIRHECLSFHSHTNAASSHVPPIEWRAQQLHFPAVRVRADLCTDSFSVKYYWFRVRIGISTIWFRWWWFGAESVEPSAIHTVIKVTAIWAYP